MIRRLIFSLAGLSLAMWPAVSAWAAPLNTCAECHEMLEGQTRGPAALFQVDVHSKRGLTCADCHGGDPAAQDPTLSMALEKGFVGRPARQDIPGFCARCHADPAFMRRFNPNLPTDQYAKYLTSQHGKANAAGDEDVAVCTSCHGVHGIRSAKDPLSPVYATNIPGTCAVCHTDADLMKRHGLPVNQHWDYAHSVHGQALLVAGDRGAPHCASCHGSHEASKPGAIAVGNVCAQCHSLSRDLFAASPHKMVHEALGLPECEVCHGNHAIQKTSDEMLGTGPESFCARCHEPGSKGFETAQAMRAAVEDLKARIQGAEESIQRAHHFGMDMEDAEYTLHEASSRLTQTRAYVHSFSIEKVKSVAGEGLAHADEARKAGEKAVEEVYFRRKGLWVTVALLGIFVLALIAKIRSMDKKGPTHSG